MAIPPCNPARPDRPQPHGWQAKVIAISQSNYIPWKGYFDLIQSAHAFVIYDDMQYTKNDWRNRNRIKTANGLSWLTIPVQVKGKATQRIRDAEVNPWLAANTLAHPVPVLRQGAVFRPVSRPFQTALPGNRTRRVVAQGIT